MDLANDENVRKLITMAKWEDLGEGDLSTGLLTDAGLLADFRLVAKQKGVFAGSQMALLVLHAYDESIVIDWAIDPADGKAINTPPLVLAEIRGPLGSILSAERVLLNFLQRLSGVATLTRRYVEAVAGTTTAILDTRKTTPGWRMLEKYAVRCGGGENHRMGLHDAVLIKDNHLAGVELEHLAATVFDMMNRLESSGRRPSFVEVEADDPAQVAELMKVVGIDVILLDNFSITQHRRAVELRDSLSLRGKVALEASGGVTLETVRAVAETGVDRISVGAITHSATAIDLSLERV